MRRIYHAVIWSFLVLFATTSHAQSDKKPAFDELFGNYCSVCHGVDLMGAGEGTPLVGIELAHGDTIGELVKSISDGYPEAGMRGWSARLTESQIRSLAIFISEERASTTFRDWRIASPLEVPKGIVTSERHDFQLEVVIDDLEPLPFSIAPLPDGRILVSEKLKGVSIVSADGVQSELIAGAPVGHGDAVRQGALSQGTGWILDVALHPEFEENGWIYLSHGDRCTDCNEASRASGQPVSMTKVIRGRLRDGRWVDEETIWKADVTQYTSVTDMMAGSRMTFDDSGHLFFSIGAKGLAYSGIQDLSFPYGKIHRVHDDGRVPEDNPFLATRGAVESTWTFGHRSPQGLEYNLETGELWGTEMGPRGGDEVNLLRPARNYGWPVVSKGVHYDGRPVSGEGLDIDFDPDEIEQPVVDLTPSIAVSSFVFYQGDAFPEWQGQMLVGSLKATDLYRFVFEDGKLVHRETLIEDLARFRDIEVGPEGEIYLLLEHGSGSRIVRVTPAGGLPRTSRKLGGVAPEIEAGWMVGAREVPRPAGASPELAAAIATVPVPDVERSRRGAPTTEAAWLAAQKASSVASLDELSAQLGVSIERDVVAGVAVYRVTPNKPSPRHTEHLFLHVHGGAYVFRGGDASVSEAALVAARIGIEALSVDYRMPPEHPFPAALDDTVAVFQHLLETRAPKSILLGGTSAGGGLALATVHQLIAAGSPTPGAIYAGTPWADLTKTGDTLYTNEGLDRVLVSYEGMLGAAARLYAGGRDLKDPLLSPVYGNFEGFPPTYFVTGTRDMFLSDTARTHQKMRAAGVTADLNVFEAMSHAEYLFVSDSLESKQVFEGLGAFLNEHLP